MKSYIQDLEMLTQEIGLRSIEMIDRYKIQQIIESMYETYSQMTPSIERVYIKTFAEKLEKALK